MFECMWKTSSIFTGVWKFCEVPAHVNAESTALYLSLSWDQQQSNLRNTTSTAEIIRRISRLLARRTPHTPTPPPWPQPLQQPTVDSTADIPAASHLAVLSAFCKFYYYFLIITVSSCGHVNIWKYAPAASDHSKVFARCMIKGAWRVWSRAFAWVSRGSGSGKIFQEYLK